MLFIIYCMSKNQFRYFGLNFVKFIYMKDNEYAK